MHFAYYAVARGEEPGIYNCWIACQSQIDGFSNAQFRKFFCHSDATYYLERHGVSNYVDCGPQWPCTRYGHGYYAVAKGFVRGIYASVGNARKQLKNYKRNEFRKFYCHEDAKRYLNRRGIHRFFDETAHELPGPSEVFKMKKSFIFDHYGYVEVYVDGACENNGRHGAAAGIGVWWNDDHRLNVSRPVYGNKATNIVAETQAVIEALKIAEREHIPGVWIYTDSRYIIDCVEKYMDKWKRNGFVNAKGEPVANSALLRELDALRSRVFNKLDYVKAHSGVRGNELADDLARAGARRYRR